MCPDKKIPECVYTTSSKNTKSTTSGVSRESSRNTPQNAKLSGYCEPRVGTKMLGCPFEADSESPQREEE